MDTASWHLPPHVNLQNVENTFIRIACLGAAAGSKEEILLALDHVHLLAPQFHKLIPIIHGHLPNTWLNELSDKAGNLLKIKRRNELALQLAHRAQIASISSLCCEHDFPLILLKSSALNMNVYSEDAPRGCNDVDLLVPATHWQKAQQVFANTFTYAEKEQADVFGDLYEESYKPSGAFGFPIDLHKSLCHPYLFNVNYAQLWNESVEHPHYNNSLVRTLSPEYQLIHLAIHGFSDMSFKTYALSDAFRLISNAQFDKHAFIRLTNQCRVQVPAYHLLSNLYSVLPEIADDSLLEQIKPNSLQLRVSLWLIKRRSKLKTGFKKKDLKFRIHQVFCMHVFTGEFFKPLALQLLFMRMTLSQMLNKNIKMRAAK